MKRKQPETSRDANIQKTFESKNRDYARIRKALEVIGSGHYEDIARQINEKDLNVVARRMKEMRDLGILRNTEIKKLTSRNRNAYVHTLCTNTSIKTTNQEKN